MSNVYVYTSPDDPSVQAVRVPPSLAQSVVFRVRLEDASIHDVQVEPGFYLFFPRGATISRFNIGPVVIGSTLDFGNIPIIDQVDDNQYIPVYSEDGSQLVTKIQASQLGAAASRGPQGFQGPRGHQGYQGADGLQGLRGYQGFQGLQGIQGSQGPSIDLATALSVNPYTFGHDIKVSSGDRVNVGRTQRSGLGRSTVLPRSGSDGGVSLYSDNKELNWQSGIERVSDTSTGAIVPKLLDSELIYNGAPSTPSTSRALVAKDYVDAGLAAAQPWESIDREQILYDATVTTKSITSTNAPAVRYFPNITVDFQTPVVAPASVFVYDPPNLTSPVSPRVLLYNDGVNSLSVIIGSVTLLNDALFSVTTVRENTIEPGVELVGSPVDGLEGYLELNTPAPDLFQGITKCVFDTSDPFCIFYNAAGEEISRCTESPQALAGEGLFNSLEYFQLIRGTDYSQKGISIVPKVYGNYARKRDEVSLLAVVSTPEFDANIASDHETTITSIRFGSLKLSWKLVNSDYVLSFTFYIERVTSPTSSSTLFNGSPIAMTSDSPDFFNNQSWYLLYAAVDLNKQTVLPGMMIVKGESSYDQIPPTTSLQLFPFSLPERLAIGIAPGRSAAYAIPGCSPVPISTASSSGNTVTITTLLPHGLVTGQAVTIAGVSQAGYNKSYLASASTNGQLVVVSDFVFTLTNSTANISAGTGGVVFPTVTVSMGTQKRIVTVTTATNHDFSVGQLVSFSGVSGLSSSLRKVIATPSATSFLVDPDLTSVPAYTSGGTVEEITVSSVSSVPWIQFVNGMLQINGALDVRDDYYDSYVFSFTTQLYGVILVSVIVASDAAFTTFPPFTPESVIRFPSVYNYFASVTPSDGLSGPLFGLAHVSSMDGIVSARELNDLKTFLSNRLPTPIFPVLVTFNTDNLVAQVSTVGDFRYLRLYIHQSGSLFVPTFILDGEEVLTTGAVIGTAGADSSHTLAISITNSATSDVLELSYSIPCSATPRSIISDAILFFPSKMAEDSSPDTSIFNANSTTRNPNLWCHDIDITCRAYSHNVTAVSSTQLAAAAHLRPGVGTVVTFVDNSNNLVTRTVVEEELSGQDWCLCTLDSALPDSIKPASLLGDDMLTIQAEDPLSVPILFLGQGEVGQQSKDARLLKLYGYNKTLGGAFIYTADFGGYSRIPRGGDSGSPLLLLVGNYDNLINGKRDVKLVLLVCFFSVAGGQAWSEMRNAIGFSPDIVSQTGAFARLPYGGTDSTTFTDLEPDA